MVIDKNRCSSKHFPHELFLSTYDNIVVHTNSNVKSQ